MVARFEARTGREDLAMKRYQKKLSRMEIRCVSYRISHEDRQTINTRRKTDVEDVVRR